MWIFIFFNCSELCIEMILLLFDKKWYYYTLCWEGFWALNTLIYSSNNALTFFLDNALIFFSRTIDFLFSNNKLNFQNHQWTWRLLQHELSQWWNWNYAKRITMVVPVHIENRFFNKLTKVSWEKDSMITNAYLGTKISKFCSLLEC